MQVHDFIAKNQSSYFKYCKENLEPDELVVVGDFTENYSFVIQDEVQSYHWSNKQATIHPFVAYYRINNCLQHDNFVIISDCKEHDSIAVHLYQIKLIKFFKQTHDTAINKIKYFSDGASSQYKNKYNLLNLSFHLEDFGINAEWHFFATSHGKNACDGIGGH